MTNPMTPGAEWRHKDTSGRTYTLISVLPNGSPVLSEQLHGGPFEGEYRVFQVPPKLAELYEPVQ